MTIQMCLMEGARQARKDFMAKKYDSFKLIIDSNVKYLIHVKGKKY